MCIVSRTGTIVAAYALLVLGFMGLAWVSFEAGNMRAILLLACAIIFGYIYQVIRFKLCHSFICPSVVFSIALKYYLDNAARVIVRVFLPKEHVLTCRKICRILNILFMIVWFIT